MNQKTAIPKGTRDFGPVPMMRRNYIFNTIRSVFELYGYQPIETPAMETLETLTGKYGDESDKLIFKILNSGDFAGGMDPDLLSRWINESEKSAEISRQIIPLITEKALRYDLTVPFARFVVQHRDEISFPFKRYQIQPVWRADRPQKGRYREFYQCDVDVIGSDSLLNEAELIRMIDEVFRRLGIPATIKINNRKILAGLAEAVGMGEHFQEMTLILDKLDKISPSDLKEEWIGKGFPEAAFTCLWPVISHKGTDVEKMHKASDFLVSSETGRLGIEEIQTLLKLISSFDLKATVELDLSLARGLNYYTGAIIEVKADRISMGSICGGGRYDDLTGIFGMPGISGVGVSFGADRIYDVLDQTGSFPEVTRTTTQVLFLNFKNPDPSEYLPFAEKIRQAGLRTEIFPDAIKIRKQLQYADNNHIPFVIMIGDEEWLKSTATIKNMLTGNQETVPLAGLTEHLCHLIG